MKTAGLNAEIPHRKSKCLITLIGAAAIRQNYPDRVKL
jgi:hypothetical protein